MADKMTCFKVTAKNHKEKKIELVNAMTAEAALNKVQRAPSGWHWERCTLSERGNGPWIAMVKGNDDKCIHFTIMDNG